MTEPKFSLTPNNKLNISLDVPENIDDIKKVSDIIYRFVGADCWKVNVKFNFSKEDNLYTLFDTYKNCDDHILNPDHPDYIMSMDKMLDIIHREYILTNPYNFTKYVSYIEIFMNRMYKIIIEKTDNAYKIKFYNCNN